jgi:toxin ParE1/3/4
MRLRFSSQARSQLQSIYDFLFERNPAAARRIIADIRASADHLIDFPHMGRSGDVIGTREWVVRGSPYLIVYEVVPRNRKSGCSASSMAHRTGAKDRKADCALA